MAAEELQVILKRNNIFSFAANIIVYYYYIKKNMFIVCTIKKEVSATLECVEINGER
jgi:hypothetical protein